MTETQTVDLAAWLTQIWDEEERLARLAGGDSWTYDGGSDIYRGHPVRRVVDWVYDEAWEHIAYHDPASVLARIAADRKILRWYTILERQFQEHEESLNESGREVYMGQIAAVEIVIHHLASAYADREGFREEWR